jgi:hypothetical protein
MEPVKAVSFCAMDDPSLGRLAPGALGARGKNSGPLVARMIFSCPIFMVQFSWNNIDVDFG